MGSKIALVVHLKSSLPWITEGLFDEGENDCNRWTYLKCLLDYCYGMKLVIYEVYIKRAVLLNVGTLLANDGRQKHFLILFSNV